VPAKRDTRKVIMCLLVISMLIIPVSSLLEREVPLAGYDIVYGPETGDTESTEVTSSPYAAASTFILLNDSLSGEQST
jgi:hypothetical protein